MKRDLIHKVVKTKIIFDTCLQYTISITNVTIGHLIKGEDHRMNRSDYKITVE